MPTNLYRQYQESAITQSDPVRLVEMMFEGAIKFTNQAIMAIDNQDMEAVHNCILRAYAIVAELMATLDFEQGGDIAIKLEQCYDYILHLLKEADVKKEKPQLAQVLKVLEPLLTTWREAFPAGSARCKNAKADSADDPEQPEQAAPDQTAGQPKRDKKPLDIVG